MYGSKFTSSGAIAAPIFAASVTPISTIRPNRTCVTRTSHGSVPFGTGSLPSTAAPAAVAVHWAVGVR